MDTSGEIEEECRSIEEDKIFVALGKDVKDGMSILSWALKNSGGRKLCILHIHKPARMIPLMGGKFPVNTLKAQEVAAYRKLEKEKICVALNEYLYICVQARVRAEKIDIEMDNVEKGIVELITQHRVKMLVMGAATDKHYSKRMTEPKSKKAIFVCEKAHVSCHIWFVCKGQLIYTREGHLEGSEMQAITPPLGSPTMVTSEAEHLRSRFLPREQKHHLRLSNPVQDFFRRARTGKSGTSNRKNLTFPFPGTTTVMATVPRSQLGAERIVSECEGIGILKRSTSLFSEVSSWSASDVLHTVESNSTVRDDGSEEGMPYFSPCTSEDNFPDSSPPNELLLAKTSEILYEKDKKQREELEALLWKEKQELGMLKIQLDQVMEELQIAQEHRSKLKTQIADSDQMVEELEDKICSAMQLLVNTRNERDELLRERDDAVREAEELRKTREEEAATSQRPHFFSEFSFLEIERATCCFDPSMRIGGGGYGSVYRGKLRQTPVAIKMLISYNLGGCTEFQQEVDELSRVRHPNLVTLIGACSEAWALIYEYLPNGSLEDRLALKNGTPPLSWQTRVRIAIEVCSALIFLKFNKPHSIVHGDLKPANILLDANFVSKLGDFGISSLVGRPDDSNSSALRRITSPKGTFAYMDPDFLVTGELTPESDVYAFGIIVLRLLTGRPARGIVKEVLHAIEKGNLNAMLDASAGNWPYVQARQLFYLALRCCDMSRKNRPNLEEEVWRLLEPMGACCGALSFSRLSSGDHYRVPSYFICPILQEIMRDPHVAADGFTYEAEALKEWFDGGHDTSPMTNLKLDHLELIPNHVIRSAIQEWLQQP